LKNEILGELFESNDVLVMLLRFSLLTWTFCVSSLVSIGISSTACPQVVFKNKSFLHLFSSSSFIFQILIEVSSEHVTICLISIGHHETAVTSFSWPFNFTGERW